MVGVAVSGSHADDGGVTRAGLVCRAGAVPRYGGPRGWRSRAGTAVGFLATGGDPLVPHLLEAVLRERQETRSQAGPLVTLSRDA